MEKTYQSYGAPNAKTLDELLAINKAYLNAKDLVLFEKFLKRLKVGGQKRFLGSHWTRVS